MTEKMPTIRRARLAEEKIQRIEDALRNESER